MQENAKTLAVGISLMIRHVFDCPAAARIIEAVLQFCASRLTVNLPSLGKDDPSKWEQCMGNAKRRRVDEDLKKFLMEENVGGERAPSSAASVAAHGYDDHHCSAWIEEKITTHLLSCWTHLGGRSMHGVWSLLEDGARFGQPARETQIYSVWSAKHACGGWLLPQVHEV